MLAQYLPAHNDREGLELARELSVPVLRRTDGLVVTDTRTGRVLAPLAGPSPPTEPPADAARALGVAEADWRHPSGGRLDHREVRFSGVQWRTSGTPTAVDGRPPLPAG